MKYKGALCLILIALFFICIILYLLAINQKVTVYYEETKGILDNPGQGYYVQIDSNQPDVIKGLREEGNRLVLIGMDLQKYQNSMIDQEALDHLRKCLIKAKENSVQVIFRGAYNFYGSCMEPNTITTIQNHMEQIATVLNEEKEVIESVQAGMIGDYGEWHDGKYLMGNEEENKEIRCLILRTWEKYLDKEIKVSVRRPRFIREAQEENILVGRLGYHNDGLLASDTDLGTYDDTKYSRQDELEWMDETLLGQHNGGEMPMVSDWSDASNANQEFMKMHTSYLNRYYNVEVLDEWKKQTIGTENAETYICSHLGYRYYIDNIRVSRYLRDGKIKVDVTIRNTGYNIASKSYQMYFVVTNSKGDRKEFPIDSEPLSHIYNGKEITLHLTADLGELFTSKEEGYICSIYFAQENDVIENRMLLANEIKENEEREYTIFEYIKKDGRFYLPLQVNFDLS